MKTFIRIFVLSGSLSFSETLFCVQDVEFIPSTQEIGFSWDTSTGFSYSIEASESLAHESWVLAADGIEPTLPTNTWRSDALSAEKQFFRVVRDEPKLPNAESIELISNTDFDTSTTPWFLVENSSSSADASLVANNGLSIMIDNAGTDSFHIQLIQNTLFLEKNSNYQLSFELRSVAAPRSVTVLVQTNTPNRNDLLRETVNLGTNTSSFVFPFSTGVNDESNCRVAFNLGGDVEDLFFESVSLKKIEDSNLTFRKSAYLLNQRLGDGNNFPAYMAVPGFGAKKDYELLRENHFSHCRIGYKLDELVGPAPDFTIPSSHLDELKRLCDLCIDEGLVAILDPIHNWANGPGFAYPSDLPKLIKIWDQVASEFSGYCTQSLVFELLNEPHSGTNIQNVTNQAIQTIRGYAGNTQRLIIISGEGFSTRQALINLFNNDEIVTDDQYLIATFHYYDPRGFTTPDSSAGTGSAIPWADTGASDPAFQQISSDFSAVSDANNAWATRNETEPLPIYLGEFGCDNIVALSDRKRWLSWVRMQARHYEFSCCHWLMYNETDFSKGLGPWTSLEKNSPAARSFQTDAVEALVGHYEAEDAIFSGLTQLNTTALGFQGSGSALLTEINDELTIDSYAPRADEYEVVIRYRCTEPIELLVESRDLSNVSIDSILTNLEPTPHANSWKQRTIILSIAGDDGTTISLKSQTNASLFVDYLKITTTR